jgi:uncharacterized protein (DUF433 family)
LNKSILGVGSWRINALKFSLVFSVLIVIIPAVMATLAPSKTLGRYELVCYSGDCNATGKLKMDYRRIITIEPGKRGGKPCVRGLRITVSDVLEYLAAGMSFEQILADFPELTEEDIRACLAFAAEKDRRLLSA